ncbi:PilZ domain-containing protein [Halioxenophilus aromaticivorans]|uniref:PilZ domain-containing protein n=1 Tax=Halioxenophilus aromaticivorans TaxID=1306992 RepID=A0AAV3TW88_9ALTE
MEQRSELRLNRKYTVLLKLAAETPAGDAAEFAIARCLDVSSDGLKIETNSLLQAGYIHEVTVVVECLAAPAQRYNLIAEIMWCDALAQGGYTAGLKLLESEDTTFIGWKKILMQELGESF